MDYDRILDSLIEDSYEDKRRVQDFIDDQESLPERLGMAFYHLSKGWNDSALVILQNLRKDFNEWVAPKLKNTADDLYIEHATEERHDRR